MRIITLLFLLAGVMNAQSVKIPEYFSFSEELNKNLLNIIQDAGLDKTFDTGEDGPEQISFAVVDLTNGKAEFGGVNADNFIYPASVYKMYAAAALLKKISEGAYGMYDLYTASAPNVVDKTKEIKTDPRPLIAEGDTVTIRYLLDLMISRSDNTAANCVIDLAGREYINEMMHEYGWNGSEVTRKYLSRKFEDPGYEDIRGTETCALHAADFMFRIENNLLVNSFVSEEMKILLGSQLDKSKWASGIGSNAVMYHKTGWWSYWTNDTGIVSDGEVKYIVALFTPVPEEEALAVFKEVAGKVHELIKKRNNIK